ncbi:GFA family protein [Acidithiobacillus acidisediminis]|uniref:GFA family protein n=1 Tax=Acidithiobacillus acidisediminis TaxID=2937799 RepID=UPI00200C2ED6|nr:GFA family protein [Acidithiobacillus sp. S30A2]
MNAKYSGKCLCGKVSYSVNAEPMFSGNCHCKDCQRSSGSAFIPAMIFREKDVDIIGEVKYFESQADSGDTHSRGFCPNCGSQLFARFSGMAGALGVKAGTLGKL